jgi:4-amino-4-deoxy-L-arabinose transferase-like glycosyltransferase
MLKTDSANNSMAHSAEGGAKLRELVPVFAVAAAILLLHLLTNTRYGFHRDELQFLSDALHLDWGYVAYPPLTPFIERISIILFGFSPEGLRLFSVLAQVAIVITAGLIARTLGGNRLSQATAALAVALAPIALFEGTEFQYTTFEQFAWVLATYGVVRLLDSEDERWWLWIATFAGLGMLAKYTVVFFLAALLAGFLLTPARRYLASRWFLFGCALTLLLVLPNLLWQVRHDFISLQFLEHIHARDLRIGRGGARDFWYFQVLICENPFALSLTITGVVVAWRSVRYRALSIAFALSILSFAVTRGRGYYTGAVYSVMIAFGSVAIMHWASSLRPVFHRAVAIILWTGFLAFGTFAACVLVPIASSGPLKEFALARSEDLREEQGWDTFVKTVAQIRDTLAPAQRANLGIVTANYGEQGAVEILGRNYGLPAPISTTNSAWLRGYPTPQPTLLIVTGLAFDDANKAFTECRFAAHVPYPPRLNNEESKYHPDIFLCGPPRLPWPEFWKKYQRFG